MGRKKGESQGNEREQNQLRQRKVKVKTHREAWQSIKNKLAEAGKLVNGWILRINTQNKKRDVGKRVKI